MDRWSNDKGRKIQERDSSVQSQGSGIVGKGQGRIFNTWNFKCLGNIPVVGGKYACGAPQTGRAVYMTLGNSLLYSEAVVVQEITQEGEKNTKDKLLEKLNV